MNPIQTIIFDLGGVLINTKTDKQWLEEDLLPLFQPAELEKLFLENFFKHFETGNVTVPEFLRRLKEITRSADCTMDDIKKHWNAALLDIPPQRIELLARLRKKYTLILMSNTNEIHLDAIQEYMDEKFGEDILEKNLHACYFSHKIGVRKPHKEAAEKILKEHNLQAATTLFLDDRQENLVEPSKLGMPTLHVDREITELLADY